MIESFVQDPDTGSLFAANGIDPVVRWDGFSDGFEEVGLDPPSVAVAMSGSGNGAIVGAYYAYERFIDSDNNPSDLSPISAAFTASGSTGTITGATSATPIVITSAAHGLPTGTWIKITGIGGIDTANNTWQITAIDANSFSLDNSNSDGVSFYSGGGTWIAGISTITYTSVQVPTEAKVSRRQILRNTDGQAQTFYVDVDTTDLVSTTFASTFIDSLLQANEAVPLLDSDQAIFANANGKPLDYFSAMAHHLDRMFLAVLVEYNVGSISATFGSLVIVGAGTDWKTTMAGRLLYVDGASQTYEIASVNVAAQTLTLTQAYADSTDLFAFYSIKPPPAWRRVVAWSEAGKPQSWLATNALSVQETGDELSGLMQKGPFIYILERRHIHKLTFAKSPGIDGAVYMAANRGCINNRCWVAVDDDSYMLDELGCHRFAGPNNKNGSVSDRIHSIFRGDSEDTQYKINWRWKQYFHAALDRQRETIRWFVSLDGSRYPKHALCLHYPSLNWWLEELPFPIGGACSGYIGGANGTPQQYYGGQHAKILAAWAGTLDLAGSDGVARGEVSSCSSFTATLGDNPPTTGSLNATISIVHGKGKGQVRRIVAVSGTIVSIDRPWSELPDSASIYQVGGVHWSFKSSWFRLGPSETMAPRRLELLFEPAKKGDVVADLRFFTDFSGKPDLQMVAMASDDGGGIKTAVDESDLTIDLTRKTGLVDTRQPSAKEYFVSGKRYNQFVLEGFTNADQVKLYQFLMEGWIAPAGGDAGGDQ